MTRRTIQNFRCSRPPHLLTKFSDLMENSQCFLCNTTSTLHWNKTHGANFPQPPPELLGGEEFYEVESIIKHRWKGRGHQYLLKWKGYPITDVTWENKSAFSDDGNMLSVYKDWHQLYSSSKNHPNVWTICINVLIL